MPTTVIELREKESYDSPIGKEGKLTLSFNEEGAGKATYNETFYDIHQLNGEWACYEEKLSAWANRIESQLKRLGVTPEYEFISRKKNQEADHLASQALEGIEITSTIEMT